jgi:NADPH:quinone reductase-like Zn-dependent oxidoreductase
MDTTQMQALTLDAEAKTATVKSTIIPEPRHGEILVQVSAIALNPVDALYVFNPIGSSGRVVGSDFAGTVIRSGSSTGKRRWATGTRVAGFLQGACSVNERPGAFAEYLICPEDLVWKIPESMSLEVAAAVSLCSLTAAQALYQRLGLKAPFDMKALPLQSLNITQKYFFIYGASTSVGMYAAQLVHRSAEANGQPIKLIGAASKARFELLHGEPYCYDALVDYRNANWPEEVLKLTNGTGINWAFDCISEGSTVRTVSKLLCQGGKVAIVRSKEYGAWDTNGLPHDVEPAYGAVWEGLGEDIMYNDNVIAASPEARSFAISFYRWLSGGGRLEANPIRTMPGGLKKIVPDGLALLGTGSMEDRTRNRSEPWMKPISAEKIVYKLDS